MKRTLLPALDSPEARQAVVESVLAVLHDWGVHPSKQAELLGLAAIGPAQSLRDDPGVLERAGHLLAIERALKWLEPHDPASRHAWLMLPNAGLGGRSPLLVMLDGLEGIKRVRARIE